MKNKYVHYFNLKYSKYLKVDRRSEDLRRGHLRNYENITKSSKNRLLKALNNLPCGVVIYPDGYSISYNSENENAFVIMSE